MHQTDPAGEVVDPVAGVVQNQVNQGDDLRWCSHYWIRRGLVVQHLSDTPRQHDIDDDGLLGAEMPVEGHG